MRIDFQLWISSTNPIIAPCVKDLDKLNLVHCGLVVGSSKFFLPLHLSKKMAPASTVFKSDSKIFIYFV